MTWPPEVLVVPETITADELALFVEKEIMPAGSYGMSYEEFSAQGRVPDCDCKLIQCVCAEARQHGAACYYRKSITCAIPIECQEHGLAVCLTCYPCSCGTSR